MTQTELLARRINRTINAVGWAALVVALMLTFSGAYMAVASIRH